MLYDIGQVDISGRVSSRGIVAALGWQPRDRLELHLTAGAVVLRTSAEGLLQVPQQPFIVIPAAARHRYAIKPGDRVLLAADGLLHRDHLSHVSPRRHDRPIPHGTSHRGAAPP